MGRTIAPLDLSFLLNESRDCPQHVAGVLVFENPAADAGWTVADLVRRYRAATPVAPFDRIPDFRRLGLPQWEQVREFDMRYHVQHVALPAPGSDAQLDELVAQWHSELIDRHRPLFQMVVVEGLEGNRFAIFAKIHHAIVDGASAIARLLGSLDVDPAAPMRAPLFAVDPGAGRRRRAPAGLTRRLSASLDLVRKQARAAGELTEEFWSKVRSRFAGVPSEGNAPFEAAATLMNAPIGYGRSFAHLSLPFAPLRSAAKAVDGTINDAVLAVVDSAVASYLDERGQPMRQPLHAMVPVSLRDADAKDAGNQVSAVICALGDPGGDVHRRLAQIVERMSAAKAGIHRLSKTAAADFFFGMYFIAQGLNAAGIRRPLANFIVSNVPGSPVDAYLGSSRLLGVYPLNILAVGLGLSVTLVSRAGRLDLGFTATRDAMPDVERVAVMCREAAELLTRPAGAAPPPVDEPAAARDSGQRSRRGRSGRGSKPHEHPARRGTAK